LDLTMKPYKLLTVAAALCACGCASFNSGDVLIERKTAEAMFSDQTLVPFSEIQLAWNNYPYRSPTDGIAGETTVGEKGEFVAPEIKSVPVTSKDREALLQRARRIFSDAGLYNREKGRGTLRLTLTSMNRWTYGELFKSYLVETGFIFLIPSSLHVSYLLGADFETSTGTMKVETMARSKTTFHLLLAPLYPLFAPGGREKNLLKQMLWRSATEVYSGLMRAGQATLEKQTAPYAESAAATPPALPAGNTAAASETPDD